jgi:hypothetical protein
LIAANERAWLEEGSEFHLVEALAQLVETFTGNPQMVSSVDRCVHLYSVFNICHEMIVALNLAALLASKWSYNLIIVQWFS